MQLTVRNVRGFLTLALAPLCLVALVACGGDAPSRPPDPPDGGGGNSGSGVCANELGGDLTVSGVFVDTPSECDYLIGRPLSLSNGTFTIEPGVVIKFAQDAYLRVDDNASLDAVGTATAPIRFEALSPVKGFAKGLNIGPKSLVTRLEHVMFTNLGKEDTGTFGGLQNGAIDGFGGGGLSMKYVTVTGSIYDGVTLDRVPILAFEANTFKDNARYPVNINAGQLHLLDAASDYLGGDRPNGRPYIYVDGVGSDGAFESATWRRLEVPYFVDIAVDIGGGNITLEPGVTFVFGAGGSMTVQGPGTLTAVGTADAPIVFTGEQSIPGYWGNLTFFQSNSQQNRLEHVQLRYGGGGVIYSAIIELPLDAYLFMKDSLVADSSRYGICIGFGSLLEYQNLDFSNNALADLDNDACG